MSQPFIFKGDKNQDVELWIDAIEIYFIDNETAEDDRIPFAFDNLSGRISACLMNLTGCLSGFRQEAWVWNWTKLKMALILMDEQINSPAAEVRSEIITNILAFGRQFAWPIIQAFLDEQTHSFFHDFDHSRYEPCHAVLLRDRIMEEFPGPSAYLRALSTPLDSPSRTWSGANFQPSRKTITDLLLKFM